ncbi:MAG: ROK family protein, partial [Mesorhizobium sp.]
LCPCGNRGCLERYVSLDARGRWNGNDADWVSEITPVFRNAIAIIENLFDPETIVLGGLASPALLERLAASVEPLHNSVSARKDRVAPRIVVAQGGQHAVLRGAAALAVSGVLSPRFGQIFTAKRQREGDPLKGGDIAA